MTPRRKCTIKYAMYIDHDDEDMTNSAFEKVYVSRERGSFSDCLSRFEMIVPCCILDDFAKAWRAARFVKQHSVYGIAIVKTFHYTIDQR